jgi:hypothetical protein
MSFHQPAEQLADRGQVLFHGGHGIPLLAEHFAVTGNVERLDAGDVCSHQARKLFRARE